MVHPHKPIVNYTTDTTSLIADSFIMVYPPIDELNAPRELRINVNRYACAYGDIVQYDGHFYHIKETFPIISGSEISSLQAIDSIETLRENSNDKEPL